MYPHLDDNGGGQQGGAPSQPAYVPDDGRSDTESVGSHSYMPQQQQQQQQYGDDLDDDEDPYAYDAHQAQAEQQSQRRGGRPGAGGRKDDDDVVSDGIDFGFGDAYNEGQSQGPWRIHATVAAIASLVSFAVWFFVQLGVTSVPWFVFVVVGFMLSLSCHFYLFMRPTRELFQVHVVWFVVINTMLFIIWDATKDEDTVAWWFIAAGGWSMLLLLHHGILQSGKVSQSMKETVYQICRREFILVNLYCWIMNMNMDKANAWFIFVVFGTGLPLFWFWFALKGNRRWLTLHAGTWGIVNLLLFLIWLPEHAFPWFVFPLLGWGLLVGAHAYWERRNAPAPAKDATRSVPATVPYVEDVRAGDEV